MSAACDTEENGILVDVERLSLLGDEMPPQSDKKQQFGHQFQQARPRGTFIQTRGAVAKSGVQICYNNIVSTSGVRKRCSKKPYRIPPSSQKIIAMAIGHLIVTDIWNASRLAKLNIAPKTKQIRMKPIHLELAKEFRDRPIRFHDICLRRSIRRK